MNSDPQVYLVGAGPGDAGLITVRGVDALRRADVVIYDGLVNRRLLDHAPAHAERIYGGRFDRNHSLPQAELNALLIERARAGRRVVRLKGGDCFIFGRGGEEAECLAQAGIPFEIIPGVSSAQAAPGLAGIPLTHRAHNSSFTVVSGHAAPSSPDNKLDWSLLARAQGTLAILMGLKNLREIAATLIKHGKPPAAPAAVISRGSTPQQKSVAGSLSNIADLSDNARLSAPAVVVIGSVVDLRAQLNWFERRPLFGRRLVVTQRLDLARPLSLRLEELGADALHVPATRWGPPPEQNGPNGSSIQNAAAFDWILFSHPSAVDHFFERFLAIHGDLRALGRARLGAYGPDTGEQLRRWFVRPEAVADDHKLPLILRALAERGPVAGQKFLIFRGASPTENVPEALAAQGAFVETALGYSADPETADPSGDAARFIQEGADWIIFASGMAIEHFHHRFDLPAHIARFPKTRLALMTPDIQPELRRLGLSPAIVARPRDIELLAELLAKFPVTANAIPARTE